MNAQSPVSRMDCSLIQRNKTQVEKQVHIDTIKRASEISPFLEPDTQRPLAGDTFQQYTLSGNSRAHFGDVYYQGPVHQQLHGEPQRPLQPRSILQTVLAAMTGTWVANLSTEHFRATVAQIWNNLTWLIGLRQQVPQHFPRYIQRAGHVGEWEGTCQLICQDLTYSASLCVATCYRDTIEGFKFGEPLHLLCLPYWVLLLLADHLGARRWRSRYPLLYLCAQVILSAYVGIAFLLESSWIATRIDSWITLSFLTLSVTAMMALSVCVSLHFSPFWSCVIKAYIHALVWWPALGYGGTQHVNRIERTDDSNGWDAPWIGQ